jgi:hypothetical protein
MIHVSTDPSYVGDAFNIQPRAREYLFIFKALLRTAGWRVLQSGDGNSAYSGTGDILTTTSTGVLNTTGAPNFYILDAATGANIVANSLSNYGAWFVFAPPNGTAASLYGEVCIQVAYLYENGANYVGVRVKYSKGGFAAGSATTAPAPMTVGDEVVLFGAGDDNNPNNTYYWINAAAQTAYLNMGVDSDNTRPCFWIESHNAATNASHSFAFWDSLTSLRTTDTDAALVGWFGSSNPAALATLGGEASLLYPGYAPTSGRMATTLTSGTTPVGAVWLANASGAFPGGLGVNTINSNNEDVMALEYARSARLPGPSGYKGRSRAFRWLAGSASRQQVDQLDLGAGVEFVLNDRVWMPLNSGSTASGGTNGVAITF